MAQDAKTIAVIDGNSLMHRAFHSMPPSLVSPEGKPTNAVSGFIAMLYKLITDFKPDGIICAFDKGRPQFRIDLLERYKAQRPHMDDELRVQFPMIHDILESLSIPIVELEGWEGDDILGTLAAKGEAEGFNMLLVTGDRDAYQLATDKVTIIANKKGMSDIRKITPEAVEELYGLGPDRIPDFYGLKGDSSDNIPGVPGIGEKKASQLLATYHTLENLLDHADEIKGKMGENLRAHMEDARVSKQVATILRNAPVEIDLADSKFPDFDPDVMREAFSALGFQSQTQRYLNLVQGDAAKDLEQKALANFITTPICEGEGAQTFLDRHMATAKPFALLLEHDQQDSLFGSNMRIYLGSNEGVAIIEGENAEKQLVEIVKRAHFISFDLKETLEKVLPQDSSKDALVNYKEMKPEHYFDLLTAAYLLDSSRANYSLDYMLNTYLGLTMPEAQKNKSKEVLEVSAIYALYEPIKQALIDDESYELFNSIEMKLLPVLVQLERNGMALDTAFLKGYSKELTNQIDLLASEIYEMSGEEFNIDSPKQLSHVLFEVMKLPATKKTKSGYSTDASVLEGLKAHSSIAEKIIEYRERTKLKSTYIDALPKLIQGDKRVHTSYNQTVTATGRLSSSNPNLQNIPVRTELGKKIREAFVVDEGKVFLSADYSQIELRLLAHLSGDEGLIDAFLTGRDFHANTASAVFGVPVDEVSAEMRSKAKAVNFGIVYGQQAYGLSQSLGIAYDEAQEMIDRYFSIYPRVRSYLDGCIDFAKEHGWIDTMYKRKRHLPDIFSKNRMTKNFGERTAMNHPMQGSAADIIKIAMIKVQDRLIKDKFSAKMIVQVHDELDFECPTDELDALSVMVREEMQGAASLKVPLEVSISSAANWAEAK